MSDDPDSMDRALALLASRERRMIIQYFDRNDAVSTSVEALTDHLAGAKVEADGGEPPTRTAEAELHHVHIPKLEDYGVVEYDSRSGEVRYHPHERLEALVEFASEL